MRSQVVTRNSNRDALVAFLQSRGFAAFSSSGVGGQAGDGDPRGRDVRVAERAGGGGRGEKAMSNIEELERRIKAAFDRIGQAVDGFVPPATGAGTGDLHVMPGDDHLLAKSHDAMLEIVVPWLSTVFEGVGSK